MAAVYVSQADIQNTIGLPALLALTDDANAGSPGATVIAFIATRATAWVDSFLAANYAGPFPIAQVPAPAMMAEAALYKAVEFLYDRRPEYIRNTMKGVRKDYNTAAIELLTRLVDGVQYMPDFVGAVKPGNVGGIVYDNAPRLMIDSATGQTNSGDF